MLSLFQRKRPPVAAAPSPAPATDLPKGLMRPESAASLLATPRRQKLLEHIWQRTSLSRKQFASLYRAPLERYAELVQAFPASEAHHHAYPGGMLDHGLEIVAYSLKLRQSHLLPIGASPEDQAAQAEAWTAAVAYAALLHDIGKVAVDLHVELADGSTWHPWHGPLRQPYRFRYRDDREYRLHSAATGLLYQQLLNRDLLDWLSGYPSLWAPLLYVLAGQYEHAGVLGELVVQADRASVAQELGGDPARAMAAPKHSLQRKLVNGLRYLLKEELKLNQPEASDGWLTEDALWLVSKTVSDKLRAHLLSQGVDGIPANNTAVFNVLQDHAMLQPTASGKAIWRATITSESGWSHAFTLLRLAPALIWEPSERPSPFAGTVTVDNAGEAEDGPRPSAPDAALLPGAAVATEKEPAASSRPDQSGGSHAIPPSTQRNPADPLESMLAMFETTPEPEQSVEAPPEGADDAAVPLDPPASAPGPSAPTAAPAPHDFASFTGRPSGEHFMAWLKQAVQTRKLIINDAKALVHTVSDTVYLISPGVFQRYAQEHPTIGPLAKDAALQDWQWVQKRFEKLGLHRKQPSGLNIRTCEVMGPRKTRQVHGYLLEDPSHIFDAVPPNNPYLSLK
ncbi:MULTISPECIES: MobH family relaxase [Pseudomonadota]|jgi:integrating conjugative element relaxase (TIGR03760 family)|uniref:TraI domain-containing protein n=23 Tax=Pseudomonadota TaxID=1224 RepID=A0A643G453_9BURK|nr:MULTISPECIES: MobH family relaxase [Pseudomonadota]EFL7022063.1 DNA-binding domain-containing protein [Escherichia coli]EKV4375451.1 TraI domain-containing protein [Citrobacter freundii]MBP8276572.1 TraI domain-containing protein [Propionivibrio sp.]MBS0511406.1 TraI domain-containing protein [Pseudomonadota bacterium]MDU7586022.1 MobH family relaxase [Acidovorax sp.]QFZ63908.1 relaxase [Pseudomonas aeruginosa PA99]GJB80019.1 helicase [Aeromonas caviae]HAT6345278.1 relaxase [Aeromonas hy